jgi:hypothetical protein
MQKVLKTREALKKQKRDAELHMQKEKKLWQIIQNREDKMKEDVQQKKTIHPEEGSRNRRM